MSLTSLDIGLDLYRTIDTPRSLTCYLLARYGEWDQLTTLGVDYLQQASATDALASTLSTEFLRKTVDLPFDADPKGAALDGWWEAEAQCCRTNVVFRPLVEDPAYVGPLCEASLGVLSRARKILRRLMGPVPNDLHGRFGKGATFDISKGACLPLKLSTAPTYTAGSACFLPWWEETAWARNLRSFHRGRSTPSPIRGNRYTSVPKTARVERGIAIEPSLNVYFQLAVGKHLSDRLKRAGIPKESADRRHGWSARESSISGDFATIDLSSASDTVALWFARYMVPPEWLDVLESLRSPFTEVNGRWVRLEKFSSMGNGFTFELETLIFLSLVLSLRPEMTIGLDVQVYGDDIICPSDLAPDLVALLRLCGFIPNRKKTYLTGPFRESCGSDYFLGKPVRGHYLEKAPDGPAAWMSLHNGLRARVKHDVKLSLLVESFLRYCVNQVPRRCRIFGPEELGDVTFHGPYEKWTVKVENSIRKVRCLVSEFEPEQLESWGPGTVLASALYGSGNTYVPRGATPSYRLRWLAYS